MKGPYDDIIHLPHHVSQTRKRMSMTDRGAQFSPFAALTGYEDAIAETGRITDREFELAADGRAMLDEALRGLKEKLHLRPEITAVYFVPDPKKAGGAYRDIRGRVVRLDSRKQCLTLEDGTVLDFAHIYEIRESN